MLTNRQRYAMYISLRFYTVTEAVVRIRPRWWLVEDAVRDALRDYDKMVEDSKS